MLRIHNTESEPFRTWDHPLLRWGISEFLLFKKNFFPHRGTYETLVPQPGIEPQASNWKQSLNHWTTREVPVQFSSVQSFCHVRLFATPCQAFLSITKCRSLPKPMSIESVMSSNHFILCRPLLLLPSVFSSIRVFSNESALRIRWPKYWSYSFNISPSHEHPGLISFRMDWLDLLAVHGTPRSLLQHHSSKASILQHSAFFLVQLSHPYMITGKTIALTR